MNGLNDLKEQMVDFAMPFGARLTIVTPFRELFSQIISLTCVDDIENTYASGFINLFWSSSSSHLAFTYTLVSDQLIFSLNFPFQISHIKPGICH